MTKLALYIDPITGRTHAAAATDAFASVLVTKAAHGFSVGQPLNLAASSSGDVWSLAQATTDLSLAATHVVVAVVDTNTFRVAQGGYWPMSLGVYGTIYLGPSAGALVTTPPSGLSIQQIGTADSGGLYISIAYPRDIAP